MHLQRYPSGLLELLGAKTGGITPGEASDVVALIVDATEYYAQSTSQVAVASLSVAALGFSGGAAVQVPNGELWRVRSVTVYTSAPLGAGQSIDLQPAFQDANGTSKIICGTTSDAATVGLNASVGWDLRTPRIFTPGWRGGCFVRNLVAGPVANVQIVVDYDRLTV